MSSHTIHCSTNVQVTDVSKPPCETYAILVWNTTNHFQTTFCHAGTTVTLAGNQSEVHLTRLSYKEHALAGETVHTQEYGILDFQSREERNELIYHDLLRYLGRMDPEQAVEFTRVFFQMLPYAGENPAIQEWLNGGEDSLLLDSFLFEQVRWGWE